MKQIGFKQFGFICIPTHVIGMFITLLGIIFLIPLFIATTRNAHSASHDLYEMFVYYNLCSVLVEIGC
jgi:hypothetical protein